MIAVHALKGKPKMDMRSVNKTRLTVELFSTLYTALSNGSYYLLFIIDENDSLLFNRSRAVAPAGYRVQQEPG